jgi:hypothetical protein
LPTRSTPSSTFSMNVFGASLALAMPTILSQRASCSRQPLADRVTPWRA